MVRYKVFVGAPRADVSLNDCRSKLTWHTALGNVAQETHDSDEEDPPDLYANTIFGQNNSASESRSWDFRSNSYPGLHPYSFAESMYIMNLQ
jgi:hypothetical protein